MARREIYRETRDYKEGERKKRQTEALTKRQTKVDEREKKKRERAAKSVKSAWANAAKPVGGELKTPGVSYAIDAESAKKKIAQRRGLAPGSQAKLAAEKRAARKRPTGAAGGGSEARGREEGEGGAAGESTGLNAAEIQSYYDSMTRSFNSVDTTGIPSDIADLFGQLGSKMQQSTPENDFEIGNDGKIHLTVNATRGLNESLAPIVEALTETVTKMSDTDAQGVLGGRVLDFASKLSVFNSFLESAQTDKVTNMRKSISDMTDAIGNATGTLSVYQAKL